MGNFNLKGISIFPGYKKEEVNKEDKLWWYEHIEYGDVKR